MNTQRRGFLAYLLGLFAFGATVKPKVYGPFKTKVMSYRPTLVPLEWRAGMSFNEFFVALDRKIAADKRMLAEVSGFYGFDASDLATADVRRLWENIPA